MSYWETMTGHGVVPQVISVAIIKAKPAIDGMNLVSVGQIEWFSVQSFGHVERPTGWFWCDGKVYKRRYYPELAYCCRPFTGWFRWHVRKQFRVPYIPAQVGLVLA